MFSLIKKAKSKGIQSLNKCLKISNITKSLFKCKTNQNSNNPNYEYFSYDKCISNENSIEMNQDSFNLPTTSTMINNNNNYDRLMNSTGISTCSCDNINHICDEMEISRREGSFISSIQKDGTMLFIKPLVQSLNDDIEDITLIKNSSKTTSPLSQYKSFNYGYQNISNDSNNYEYLHSTKINSQESTSELVHLLQPTTYEPESFGNLSCNSSPSSSPKDNKNNSSSHISTISSPISTSTSFSSKIIINNQRQLNLNSMDSTYVYNNNVNNCYNTLNDQSSNTNESDEKINQEIKNCESLLLNLTSFLNNQSSLSSSLSSTDMSSNEQIYVCTCDYQGTFVEDLSVQFADKIRILRDNNEEWLYVESSHDGKKGYIPRDIAIDAYQFIDQLSQHHSKLINSRSSSFSSEIHI